MMDVFSFNHYRPLLSEAMDHHPNKGRGLRAQLARFLKCQPTHVSHVLGGRLHFTLEQAEASCRFFDFSEKATEYVLNLVQMERAGNQELRDYFKKRVLRAQKEEQQVKNAVLHKNRLDRDLRPKYYSHWLYSAVHMCLNIAKLTAEGYSLAHMADYLHIPLARIEEAVEFLETCGIVAKENGGYVLKRHALHISDEDIEVTSHHRNLRLRALEMFPFRNDDALYFSSFISCTKEDVLKMRKLLLDTIKPCSQTVSTSKPELLWALNIDFFSPT